MPPKQTPEQRFSYVKYDARATADQQALKEKFIELTKLVEDKVPIGRPLSLCLTALEEAYMWTGKGIRDDQIVRQGMIDDQPERNGE
jgi:hypothetical protein